jgi:hypothetical protein
MAKKHAVQVRNGDGTVVETIKRVLRAESIGNFNPLFCSYRGKARCLVESDALHLDDPFRCCESDHAGKLFIRPRGKDGRVVATWEEVLRQTT